MELNYSSDIDLISWPILAAAPTSARTQNCLEYFERLAREIVKLLGEATELGAPYRVDLRLRPEGQSGPIVATLESALHYYDVSGRTWNGKALREKPAPSPAICNWVRIPGST